MVTGLLWALLLPTRPASAQAPGGEIEGTAATARAAAERRPSPAALTEAEAHFRSGTSSYQERDYAAAQREFLLAYSLSRLPDLLINVAAASESLGRPDEAILFLSRYLQERPTASDVLEVQSHIDRLEKLARKTHGTASPQAPAPAAKGPSSASPEQPPWPRQTGSGLAGPLALTGAGAVALLAGVGMGAAALSAARQVESAPRFDAGLYQRGKSLDAAGIAADAIGGATLLAGAIWSGIWFYHRRHRGDAGAKADLARALILPGLPTGPGLAVAGSF